MVVGLSWLLSKTLSCSCPQISSLHLGSGDIGAVDAGGSVSTLADAGGLRAVLLALEALADNLDIGGNSVGDGGSVTEVGVDTSKQVASGGRNTIDCHMTLNHGVAVAARTVQLSEVLDSEVRDGNGTGSVVLDNLLFDKN